MHNKTILFMNDEQIKNDISTNKVLDINVISIII